MNDEKKGPAELEEARQARALAEALDGKAGGPPPGEALEAAAQIAAACEPVLSAEARSRIGDELFGAQVKPKERRSSRWLLFLAATVLFGISAMLIARERLAANRLRQNEEARSHQAAQALVAALLPGDPASRAQAIADGAAR